MESIGSNFSEDEQSTKSVEESARDMYTREKEFSTYSRELSSSSSFWKIISPTSTSTSPSDCSGLSKLMSNGISRCADTAFPDLDTSDLDFLDQYNYRIIEFIGSGAFGNVYQARIKTKYPYISKKRETVAIKVLKEGIENTNIEVINRVIDTTDRLIQIQNTNIVETYSYAHTYRRLYIFREFAEMPDLWHALHIKNRLGNDIWWALGENQARYLIKGIASGVAHMHRNGMSHSDLKLDNILLFWSNNVTPQQKQKSMADILTRDKYLIYEWIPKLTDFDKCMFKKADDPEGKIMSKYRLSQMFYSAPESFLGIEYDLIKADCYSIGCCLMTMLLASYPFENPLSFPDRSKPNYGTKWAEYAKICYASKMDTTYIKQLIKHFSPELRQVLEKLLDPNSETRISMNELLADQWFLKTEH